MVFSSPTILTYETVRFRLPGYKPHPESPAVGCQMRRREYGTVGSLGAVSAVTRRHLLQSIPGQRRTTANIALTLKDVI